MEEKENTVQKKSFIISKDAYIVVEHASCTTHGGYGVSRESMVSRNSMENF